MPENVKVLISWNMGEEFVNGLRQSLYNIDNRIRLIAPETKDKEKLKELIADTDILLPGVADTDLLEAGKNLKFIQALTSSVARIDLSYTSKRNISVCSGKGPESTAVAEHTLMLMLMLAKNASITVSRDSWLEKKPIAVELYGKKVGILGAGHIGSEVAKLTKSLGMSTHGIDKYIYNASHFDYFSKVENLYEVLPTLDFLTIHVPRTPETTNMISRKELQKMNNNSYLINVARGQVVNLDDLESTLRFGLIRGAAVDVFPLEPPDYSHPIFKCSNFIYTPHLAGITKEAKKRMIDYVSKNIKNFLYDKPLFNLVDPEVGF